MSVQGAVANRNTQQPQQGKSIAGVIRDMTPEIQRALPKGMDADRVARLALTVVRKTPKLAECSAESFAGALLTASALGLEIGAGDEAYLVPYGRECQLIIGYQGMAKLFYQSPLAANLDAQAVYEHDDFDYAYGTSPFLRHKPAMGERGDVTHYYAVASLNTGASAFVVLSPEECKALRQGKVGPDSRFKAGDPMKWMERKTAVRQLVKLLPRSTSLTAAVAAEDATGTELHRGLVSDRHAALEQRVDTDTGEVLAIEGEKA